MKSKSILLYPNHQNRMKIVLRLFISTHSSLTLFACDISLLFYSSPHATKWAKWATLINMLGKCAIWNTTKEKKCSQYKAWASKQPTFTRQIGDNICNIEFAFCTIWYIRGGHKKFNWGPLCKRNVGGRAKVKEKKN